MGAHPYDREASHTAQRVLTGTMLAERSDRHIRRLPTWASLQAEAGAPKAAGNKSLLYKAVRHAMLAYEVAAGAAINANGGQRVADVLTIRGALTGVVNACATYNAKHHTDQRARFVAAIGQQARLEDAVLTTRARYFDNDPTLINGQTWASVLPTHMGTREFNLRPSKGEAIATGGQAQGGANTVTEYTVPNNYTGMYKEDAPELRQQGDERNIGQTLGIPVATPRLADRSIAMYRIDQLLGANVIARTDRAFSTNRRGNRTSVGTISLKAPGSKASDLGNANDKLYQTAASRGADGNAHADAITFDDPVLQRCLSKLEIVDALVGQVDRALRNIYIDTDGAGNVTGLLGIDNDLAFPETNQQGNRDFTDVDTMYREYAGVGMYFDAEVANMVLALQPADLAAVVADVLPQAAIGVMLQRLTSLQAKIGAALLSNDVIAPHQWDAQTAQANAAGGSGYVSDNRRNAL